LSSKIYYMELNPYWNVPQSIIRKEIIPTYRRDTTYFTRNRMKVYDKNGTQVDPHSIKWAKYAGKGVPYTVKQDNKAGNSLGRIIFRFPNPYS
ncbi:L,D-transpeptidase, partial [Pseudomonas donghuensis]|nr:L,D-transpeptidase [Pseudomonas donghuensis]